MGGAFDMPACVVFASHVDDSEIPSEYFSIRLHHSRQLLFGFRCQLRASQSGQNRDANGRRTRADINAYGFLNDMICRPQVEAVGSKITNTRLFVSGSDAKLGGEFDS
jgi:hypothetical protein